MRTTRRNSYRQSTNGRWTSASRNTLRPPRRIRLAGRSQVTGAPAGCIFKLRLHHCFYWGRRRKSVDGQSRCRIQTVATEAAFITTSPDDLTLPSTIDNGVVWKSTPTTPPTTTFPTTTTQQQQFHSIWRSCFAAWCHESARFAELA